MAASSLESSKSASEYGRPFSWSNWPEATTPDSPPGTNVIAVIPTLFGPGLSAEMSYYETVGGARVFAAGVLDFGGSVTFWPIRRMIDNLWSHMLEGVPASS